MESMRKSGMQCCYPTVHQDSAGSKLERRLPQQPRSLPHTQWGACSAHSSNNSSCSSSALPRWCQPSPHHL